MVEKKDVVLGLLGASAGLGGLALVFLGFAVTTIQSYDAETPSSVVHGYKTMASIVGVAFVLAIVTVTVCTGWLTDRQPGWLYDFSIAAFFAQLALLALGGLWALVALVWRG